MDYDQIVCCGVMLILVLFGLKNLCLPFCVSQFLTVFSLFILFSQFLTVFSGFSFRNNLKCGVILWLEAGF